MSILGSLFGMSGKDIYYNFRGGTGDDGAGLTMAALQAQRVHKNYELRTTSITNLTTKMEGAWQGDAAGAARRGAGPLAVEHGLAAPEITTARETLNNQVEAFTAAKSSVVEVPSTPEKPGLWDNVTSFGGAGRSYEDKMNEVNAANDHNVAVMETYEGTTETNTSSMPTSYGRITDDYSAVGVLPPSPPPPGKEWVPPDDPSSNTNTSTNTNNTFTPTNNPQNQNLDPSQNPNNNNQTDPSQNRPTDPSQHRPGPIEPPRGVPSPSGGGNNQNPGGPGYPGYIPPGGGTGFGPTGDGARGGRGGGPGGFGGRGPGGFGPGGGGGGAGGAGGSGGSGSGGAGGRGGLGSGMPGGAAAAAAEGAAARGGVGGRGGMGMGGAPMGAAGNRGQGDDDAEHERPSFLVEPDPHDTFGTDEVTAPPVIGE